MFRKFLFNYIRNFENSLNFNVKFYHKVPNGEALIQGCCWNIKNSNFYKSHQKKIILYYSSTSNTVSQLHDSNLTDALPLEVNSSAVSELTSSINESTLVVSEPLLSSLGLGGFTPSGLVQTSLEFLHVNCELPWWQAIVAGTIVIRFTLFPLVIKAQRNAVSMQNHLPTMQRMQEDMIEARRSGNLEDAIKCSHKLTAYMKINKINPLKNFLVPMAQVPIFISVFTGIRQMANLPVESWKTGGTLWFTDLTVIDPYFLLPFFTVATLSATIELGADGVKASNMDKNVRMVIRILPIITFPFICNFPSAMLCYWFTSNAFSMIQVIILKIPAVKKYFNIPLLIDHGTAFQTKQRAIKPKMSFMESIKEHSKNIQLAHEMAEREKLNSLKLKDAIVKRDTSHKAKLKI